MLADASKMAADLAKWDILSLLKKRF